MATPPLDAPAGSEMVKPSSHTEPSDMATPTSEPVAEIKSLPVKEKADAMSDEKDPAGTNGSFPPAQNGHSTSPTTNGVENGTKETEETSSPASKDISTQQETSSGPDTTSSTDPATQTTVATEVEASPAQKDDAVTPAAKDDLNKTPSIAPEPSEVPSQTAPEQQQALTASGGATEPPASDQTAASSVDQVSEEKPAPEEKPVPSDIDALSDLPLKPDSGAAAATPPKMEPTEIPVNGASATVVQDQEMPDAPLSPTKVSREREEDGSEEPAAKRAKTDDISENQPEFKLPEKPASAAPADATQPSGAPITKLQNKALVRCMQALKRTHDARFYKLPVDPIKLNIPSYPTIINNPMDLGTIESKLKSDKYSTLDEVIADFKLMVGNSVTFNGPDHMVSREGANLQQNFEKHLAKLPGPDEVEPTAAEKKAKKATNNLIGKLQPPRREPRVAAAPPQTGNATSPTTFALSPDGLPLIRRDSTTIDGRPKRSIHPPKNRDLPYTAKPKKKKFQWELKFCEEVLDELHKSKHYSYAVPFYLPVDPVALNIPTYHNVIKKPMDLQTVRTKLQSGQYENAKEMEMDIRMMFKNCYKFNIPGDPTYASGKRLEEVFDMKWANKARWIEAHDPSSAHHSAVSSDNESSDEVEESDDEQEKLTLLQKQIEAMSKQVEAITKKKKTPPAALKKSSKSKSGKKDSRKGSSAKKGAKAKPRSGKPEKQRWITYREKQIISTGISSLPDKKMTEALRIIQQNMPSLKGTNETEIELDIDELPNDVLLMLLKYVKKHAPQVMEYDDPEPEPIATPAPSKPKKNKPMSKHEQEAQISRLTGNLSRFQGGGGHSSDPMPSVEAQDTSDDDDSEESEEE